MGNKRTHIAVLAALLAACATAQDVEHARSSWQGATYEDVLRAWGAPARSAVTADGRYWYTWETAAYPQPGPSVGIGVGGVRIGGGGAPRVRGRAGKPVGAATPPPRRERPPGFHHRRGGQPDLGGPPPPGGHPHRP